MNNGSAARELAELIEKFQARAEVLVTQFHVEATAIAWKIAAEQLNRDMPAVVASGSMSWSGKPARRAEMIINSPRVNVKGIIKGGGKIKPTRNGVSNSQKIIGALGKEGPMTTGEMAKHVPGASNATLRGLLSKMKSEKKVAKTELGMWALL